MHAVEGYQEAKRQEAKNLAQLLYGHAILVNHAFAGQKNAGQREIWDYFPVWTEDEIREMKVARVRAKMERFAARRVIHDE